MGTRVLPIVKPTGDCDNKKATASAESGKDVFSDGGFKLAFTPIGEFICGYAIVRNGCTYLYG